MAERIEYYKDIEERDSLKAAAYALGETVIHDDFVNIDEDENLFPTNGQSGRLTFDVIVVKADDADTILYKSLLVKLESKSISNSEIIDLLKFKIIDHK